MNSTDKQEAYKNLENQSWEELYVLTEHWISDLEFYKDDLKFLHHLVDKYFIWITKSENLEMVKELIVQIRELENLCVHMLDEIIEHKNLLGSQSRQPDPDKLKVSFSKHELLETAISTFVKNFRANRKEVFRITEYIMDSEALSDVIKS